MDSRRKSKVVLKPCSSAIRGSTGNDNEYDCQIFMNLRDEEIKNCIIGMLEICSDTLFSSYTKYLSIRLFLNFLLKNPFYHCKDANFVMVSCFWTAFQTYQPAQIQLSNPLQKIIQSLDLSFSSDEIHEFQQQFLEPLSSLCKQRTPYHILDSVNEYFHLPSSLYQLIISFIDFSLTETQFALHDPQTIFSACFIASCQNTSEIPSNLEGYVKKIEIEVPLVKKISCDLLATLIQLWKDEGEIKQE